ncbi:MAG: D-alanine--D-alanine ligase [candidate division Zixibacteria bacterium]|nr:D-alanine--D-alanine ligase [candidate division Zixibacteria bacterium]
MNTRKLNIAVLMGGKSAEHEVSLSSGRMILKSLDRSKYNVKPVTITKEGKWLIPPGYLALTDGKPGEEVAPSPVVTPLSTGLALQQTAEEGIDVVFLALHGTCGEDGTIQGLLELVDLPYTGSGVLASALAMHKVRSLQIFQQAGLCVARYRAFDRWQWEKNRVTLLHGLEQELGFPCVVLPVELGSSVGVTIARDVEHLAEGIDRALEYGNEVLVEEYLAGEEVTCGVLGNLPGHEPVALMPTHIIPKTHEFFDYEAKYTPGATEEITPPRLPETLIRETQRVAVVAHKALGCAGLSRSDMRIRDGVVYMLETNTLPGMTPTSLFPQAAAAAGMSFASMLDRLIELAIAHHEAKRKKVSRE